MPNNEDDIIKSSKMLENDLYDAMRNVGSIIPQTIEDVAKAEKELESEQIDLPKTITNPDKLFDKTVCGRRFSGFVDNNYNAEMEENLAQAARERGKISEEVLEKMKKDRKKAENNSDE